jgi:hypothetical protein
METQINSFFTTAHGSKVITIFGYSTKGVPGLEVIGMGKLAKNIKEKCIYLTRIRRLSTPLRRFVICVDLNDLDDKIGWQHLKWLEFPILLAYWHMAGLIPVNKLEDCLTAGHVNAKGEVVHLPLPEDIQDKLKQKFNPLISQGIKHISCGEDEKLWNINSSMLCEHIPQMSFKY